jgi:hypothetical protein
VDPMPDYENVLTDWGRNTCPSDFSATACPAGHRCGVSGHGHRQPVFR